MHERSSRVKHATRLEAKYKETMEEFVNAFDPRNFGKITNKDPVLGNLLSQPDAESIAAVLHGMKPEEIAKVIVALKANTDSQYKVCDPPRQS